MEEIRRVVGKFKSRYEEGYRRLLPLLMQIADQIPKHRERYENVEIAGEARRVGGLPAVRAIKFAASCYSLGLPPGIIGVRAFRELNDRQKELVAEVCPAVPLWIRAELEWLNLRNLESLAVSSGADSFKEDAKAAVEWAGRVEPHAGHAEITGRIAQRCLEGDGCSPLVLEAARLRGFLG